MENIKERKCDSCLKNQERLIPFAKVTGVVRESPVFSPILELCWPCYKTAVQQYVRETQAQK